MTQAWDFVDADILWAVDDGPKRIRLTEIDWPGVGLGARIVGMRDWCESEQTWKPSYLTLGDLAAKTEAELMREPNIGRKALNAIKEVLAHHGLHLGMS